MSAERGVVDGVEALVVAETGVGVVMQQVFDHPTRQQRTALSVRANSTPTPTGRGPVSTESGARVQTGTRVLTAAFTDHNSMALSCKIDRSVVSCDHPFL